MRHGSLFSGIGGFDLAAEWMGWENVFQVEWDSYCQKVLTKNFPNVQKYGDIKEFKGKPRAVDIISGGFPCQPFSHAGKRKGQADDRYLWPEMLRIIREIKPSFVVGENVAGLVSMENGKTLEGIFSDLENEGYQTESFIIPACAVGAWHRRDRIWIVAYNNTIRRNDGRDALKKRSKAGGKSFDRNEGLDKDVSNTASQRPQRCVQEPRETERTIRKKKGSKRCANGGVYRSGNWDSEPSVGRVVNGVSGRVDRLKGLGNAIVPQVAYEIFKVIEQISIT